jgi:hypothetical protein
MAAAAAEVRAGRGGVEKGHVVELERLAGG